MPAPAKSQQPNLLDEIRRLFRVHHYSIHAERCCVDYIVQFITHEPLASPEVRPPKLAPIWRVKFLQDLNSA